jgi:PPOX class probable F420-dependent enzyme
VAYHRAMSDPLPLPEAVRRFLEPPRFAVLATLDPGGAPRQAVAWYLLAPDGSLVVNSAAGRRWPANLRRDARVSVAVLDGGDGYVWVGLTGRVVEVIDDQEQAQADIAAMARRYHADDPAMAERMIERTFRAQRRVSFRIAISAVHDHLEE